MGRPAYANFSNVAIGYYTIRCFLPDLVYFNQDIDSLQVDSLNYWAHMTLYDFFDLFIFVEYGMYIVRHAKVMSSFAFA